MVVVSVFVRVTAHRGTWAVFFSLCTPYASFCVYQVSALLNRLQISQKVGQFFRG